MIWTNQEIAFLKEKFPHENTEVIARELERSYASVAGKASLLDIKKSEAFHQSQKSKRLTGKQGASTRFKKGNIPHNKGKVFPSRGRSKQTQFKKGGKPHNTKSIGDVSIRQNSKGIHYAFIKVGDGKWPHLHRVVWEAAFGKIPKGSVIRFKDGNQMNCDISNLELIGRDENMERNSIHRFPKELKTAIRKVRKLERIIKKKENEKSAIRS